MGYRMEGTVSAWYSVVGVAWDTCIYSIESPRFFIMGSSGYQLSSPQLSTIQFVQLYTTTRTQCMPIHHLL